MSASARLSSKVLKAPLASILSTSVKCSRSSVPKSLASRRSLPTGALRTVFTQSPARRAEAAATTAQPPRTASPSQATPATSKPRSLDNLEDQPLTLHEDDPTKVDWTRSFHGLSVEPFSKEAAAVLLAPIDPEDIEIKPDGIIYLPEIKYRPILNKAFGPGGWGLAPRGETIVTDRSVTREYALLAHGRWVKKLYRLLHIY